MKHLSLLVLILLAPPTKPMSESEESYEDAQTGIIAIPLEQFKEEAALISQAQREGSPDYEWVEEDWEEIGVLFDTEEEEEIDDESALQEHRELFDAAERDIYQSTIHFLNDRNYPQWLQLFRKLVRVEQKRPSEAVPMVAQLMLKDTRYEYAASELLEYIRKKLCPWWADWYGNEHMHVESHICNLLSTYYLDKFNTLVTTTHPQEPTTALFTALQKCTGNIAGDPDYSWQDMEYPEWYVYKFGKQHLRRFILWHLEKTTVRPYVEDITANILLRAGVFFSTVSYGWMNNSYDLLYLLRTWGFKGFPAHTSTGKKQHIWIQYPYQVRITQTGKVTVALIKEDPLVHQTKHGSVQISKIVSRAHSHEVLKLSADEQYLTLVPAFVKEQKFKQMWDESDPTKQKRLMGNAHHRIDPSYMDFEKVERQNLEAK